MRTNFPTGNRESGPLGCNFLSEVFLSTKETLEKHLAQDVSQVFLWYSKTLPKENYSPVGPIPGSR